MRWPEIDRTIAALSNAKHYGLSQLEKIEATLFTAVDGGRRIVFTGVGKSGHVARQMASTYASLGIPSRFIDPVDILHGEMGTLDRNNDFIVYISKSGNTDELLPLAYKLWNQQYSSILITSNPNPEESLVAATEKCLLASPQEMDMDNVVPTISLVLYATVLQAVGIHIAERLRLHDYRRFKERHPGGSIGKTVI